MVDWKSYGIPVSVVVLLLSAVKLAYRVRKYMLGEMYTGMERMDGKTVAITGANSGIGFETAVEMVRRGAEVIILCRDPNKAADAALHIKFMTGSDVTQYKLDLSSLQSVRDCAAAVKCRHPKIHVLINNAGIMACPRWETKDGFEMQFGTNHLGPFLLTLLLLGNVKAAAPSRIVNVSSNAHHFTKMNFEDLNYRKNYAPTKVYGQSKLANVLFTKSLAQRLNGSGVSVYALNPGWVQTELMRHLQASFGWVISIIYHTVGGFLAKTPIHGAQTTIYCAVADEVAQESGMYYSECRKQTSSKSSMNMEDAERLWKISAKMVRLDNCEDVPLHTT